MDDLLLQLTVLLFFVCSVTSVLAVAFAGSLFVFFAVTVAFRLLHCAVSRLRALWFTSGNK